MHFQSGTTQNIYRSVQIATSEQPEIVRPNPRVAVKMKMEKLYIEGMIQENLHKRNKINCKRFKNLRSKEGQKVNHLPPLRTVLSRYLEFLTIDKVSQ